MKFFLSIVFLAAIVSYTQAQTRILGIFNLTSNCKTFDCPRTWWTTAFGKNYSLDCPKARQIGAIIYIKNNVTFLNFTAYNIMVPDYLVSINLPNDFFELGNVTIPMWNNYYLSIFRCDQRYVQDQPVCQENDRNFTFVATKFIQQNGTLTELPNCQFSLIELDNNIQLYNNWDQFEFKDTLNDVQFVDV